MKYLDEYRDAAGVRTLAEAIRRDTTKPWKLMEVCGGQTHAIVKFGIDELLPDGVTLLHGPGCPVCVTPIGIIDQALELAARPGVIFCSFGDMLRVPGTDRDLFAVKAAGGDVRMVYSPLDALAIARQHPDRAVIFFAVGFETTAPANAMAVYQAAREGLTNFFLLVSHVLVPPAIEALLANPDCPVQAFLAAGHVCAIAGCEPYIPLAEKYHVPIVVTGFEPVDILRGIHRCILQLEQGRAECENAYARAVRPQGNVDAMAMVAEVFAVVDRTWRGMGEIPASGLGLAPAYAAHDAARHFGLTAAPPEATSACISGLVLQGLKKPHECPAFGTRCTPEKPLGATMVSNEGACAAYYRYRHHAT
jgi:hydrogenase expression/formation protein HypD